VHDDPGDAPRWLTHGERTLYDNPWVRLTQVDVEAPDGARWWHHVVRLQTMAVALVLDDHDRVLMLWRHRFVPDTFGWELPGGIVGSDETGLAAAVRETEEETGWRPTGEAQLLVAFEPMPGLVSTRHEVYLMRGAKYVSEPTDAQEAGHVAWVPLRSVPELTMRGKIAGSGSLVGLLYVLASRQIEH